MYPTYLLLVYQVWHSGKSTNELIYCWKNKPVLPIHADHFSFRPQGSVPLESIQSTSRGFLSKLTEDIANNYNRYGFGSFFFLK